MCVWWVNRGKAAKCPSCGGSGEKSSPAGSMGMPSGSMVSETCGWCNGSGRVSLRNRRIWFKQSEESEKWLASLRK
jgi:DnaJ-class molecular chaperone